MMMRSPGCHPEERALCNEESPSTAENLSVGDPSSQRALLGMTTWGVMICLLLVFIVPMILSGLLFFYHEYFQLKSVNRGTLIRPPIPIQQIERKWHILYGSGSHCDSDCVKVVRELNQIKKALGKNKDRLDIGRMPSSITLFNEHRIYLSDPLGNLFMYYPDTVNPMDILKDLKRVLEVSQIG